jgi:cyclic beta-1,2-glucan synthetase
MATADPKVASRIAAGPHTPVPEVQVLSNGRYHVVVTSAGGGYSRWEALAITRWREDAACDNWGSFCYLRDLDSGDVWSNTYQPALRDPDVCDVVFATGRATFRRCDRDIETLTDIAVAPEDDVELRRLRITSSADTRRTIEVTSYAEIVLAPPDADAAHPAFSKLFVETEILRDRQAILCKRRPRAPGEAAPWMFHLLVAPTAADTCTSYETDRMSFIGRGRTIADPQALDDGAALSGSAGPVLDPLASIRRRLVLDPGASMTVDLISGVGATRDACLSLIAKYRSRERVDDAFAAAPAHARATLGALGIDEADARLYARLAGHVIYASASMRAGADVLERNRLGQPGLWSYAISGDLPIVLLRMADAANADLVRQLARAHAYWRVHGLAVDLVIVAADRDDRQPPLHQQVATIIGECGQADRIDRPGGIFVRSAGAVPEADQLLLQAVARVVINDADGTLARQLERRGIASTPIARPAMPFAATADRSAEQAPAPRGRTLHFDNGLGGFTSDGREYVITAARGRMTPAPWVNILANPSFGTLVSESGSANTWSENAQTFRLTPWSNDPVGDANTEACYIRDEDNGRFWSPTLLPAGGDAPYVTRHGFGYSVFEHDEDGIGSTLAVYVAVDAPVKFAVLKLHNGSGRSRRLSVTGYVEWVLGDARESTGMHVCTQLDAADAVLYACNHYSTDFAGRIAFFTVDDATGASFCGDRAAFIGRNGTLRNPAAMAQSRLSGIAGAALDPCAAIRVAFELADGATREWVFRLGVGASAEEAQALVRRHRGSSAAHDSLAAVDAHWQRTLGAVQIETPDAALDVLANGWLVYQVIACRLWARTAFYQASGAFGFRDQLQDVMALLHAAPELAREHLLRCASRQFAEGDVQHWWHPPSGRGVRTRCSDDYLWLPLATCRYVAITGDAAILDAPAHFLEGRALEAAEESYYDLPTCSADSASLYHHCTLAIEHGLRFGTHGLPLMGSCDWNDGMNLVGAGGKGESVWLAFFLYAVLTKFGALARQRDDLAFADRCLQAAAQLREDIERSSWDGGWYRRAWFDDGSPLGTSGNAECRIDSIAQSWSVLSGAGGAERMRTAMDAVDRLLVDRDAALVQLLDPPFDHSDPNPGYIQGYLRGVRENGGQYTHAAVWATMAFAALGDAARAWELCTLINPLNHANSPQAIAVYKTEPYVVTGDVYALPPHAGRGGWTWYTGSAGWMYRLILESLLGLTREADKLHFAPCVPAHWRSFRVRYRYRNTAYAITVLPMNNAADGARLVVDGVDLPGTTLALVDDGRTHVVEARVLAAPA